MPDLMTAKKGRNESYHTHCRDHESKKCNNRRGYLKCKKSKVNCISIQRDADGRTV